MPIHILSLFKVPKMVSNRIQKLFANFLWNSQGNNRLHWIGWHQICHPYAEGGLGIRNMNTVMQSLQSKFAWRFTQGDSLWAQIVRSKYGTFHHILQKGIRPSSSHCWKAIAKHLPLISNLSRMIIRSGNSSFWKENWLGRPLWFPACPLPTLSVKEALNIPPLLEVLLDSPQKEVAKSIKLTEGQDKLIFTLAPQANVPRLFFMKKCGIKVMSAIGPSTFGMLLSPLELLSLYGKQFSMASLWTKSSNKEASLWPPNAPAVLTPIQKAWNTSFFKEKWVRTSGVISAKLSTSLRAGICPLCWSTGSRKLIYPPTSA
ncbi:hypothetical protein CFOL_v3_08187 [Cephalotus follicularis]|uniref:Zf-RVT domain-containing protein n=1 Tax=Cephalotus follicularis TaxID=3775 RepID=A0A1Q3B9T9_CEPFO|nr:hypothetical protein CFOL_v3_08187 [Cephalotus follicularis]